jgi:predicted ArsR family transcriptional regulator
MGDWTFFSNHGHVLVCLARDRDARLRDVAVQVGITERAVQKIVRDLQDEGFLEVRKHGRRNRYRINNRKALRHSLQSGCTVGQLIALMNKSKDDEAATPGREKAGKASPRQPPGPDEKREKEPAIAPTTAETSKGSSADEESSARSLEQGRLF